MATDKELYDQYLFEQYQAESGSIGQPREQVLNEQYEPIQGADRALIKNLSGDNEGIMNYLHSKHKDSEFKIGNDNEVLGRDRGQKDWKKMDVDSSLLSPSTWELQDISDISGDVAGGIAEGAAAVGGGVAGTALGPAGTVGGAMAGAGAAAGSIEALKQKLAQNAGIRAGEIDGGQIAQDAAISAVTTPLFGVGGGGKLAKKAASMSFGNAAEKQAAIALAKKAEEGYLSRAIKAGGKKLTSGSQTLASMTSGVAKQDFDTYFKNFDQLEKMETSDAIELSDSLFDSLQKGVSDSKMQVSDMYNSLKVNGKNVDISDTVYTFAKKKSDILNEISRKYKKNDTIKNELKNELDVIENEIFGDMVANGTGDIDVENVMNMEKMVKDYFTDTRRTKGSLDTAKARYVNDLIKDVSEGLSKNIDTSFKNSLDGKSYTAVKKAWKDSVELEDTVKNIVKNPATMYGNLLGIDTKAGIKKYKIEQLKEITERFGIPYEESARKLRAYTFLKNPEWMPTSGTATSTSRSLLGGGIGGTLGFIAGGNPATAAAGAALGSMAGSPASMKGLGKAGRKVGKSAGRLLDSPVRTPWMRVLESSTRDSR